MKNKAMSMIVSAVILMAIAIALIAVVWVSVDKVVKEKLDEAGSCHNTFEKITVNNNYTCYDGTEEKLQISINRGDINLESVLISVSFEEEASTYRIFNVSQEIEGITNYPSGTAEVILPKKDAGKTYFISDITSRPTKIQLAPKVNKNQCTISDVLNSIDFCV